MDEYTALASIYDEFMDNIDYEAWGERIAGILSQEGIADGLVLDLGCGTGIITEFLAKKGYDMTGVDCSEEMLQKAMDKKNKSGADILYLLQDMREFELYGTMRAIVSTCDSLNYIIEPEELLEVFRLVNNYLDPGGIFVFDFNTKKKYADIGNTSISETRDSASFIWENFYNRDDYINEYQLTIFLPVENDLYKKYEEYHVQRGYDLEEIKELLKRAGLVFERAYDGYSDECAHENSDRIVVVAREKGK
jgi:ubiquinone/menaquinone biosynthesis C-methylase UbiE